jgi:hypothetical protein
MQLKCVCGQRVREANSHCLPTAPTVNKPCLLFHSAGSQGDLFMAWLRGFFGPLESMDKRRWAVSSVKYFYFICL